MLAYLIPSENRYVRTQGEAKKLGFGEATEVPTDKDGLLDFLNGLRTELAANKREAEGDTAYVDDAPSVIAVHAGAVTPPVDMTASAVLSRMDNPNIPLDDIIETIAKMKGGYALKRVAGAVAIRFEELSK